MDPNVFKDLEPLASLEFSKAAEVAGRALMDKDRSIREAAGRSGVRGGVLTQQLLDAREAKHRTTQLALVETWIRLIRQHHGRFGKEALAFVETKLKPTDFDRVMLAARELDPSNPTAIAQRMRSSAEAIRQEARRELLLAYEADKLKQDVVPSAPQPDSVAEVDEVTGVPTHRAYKRAVGVAFAVPPCGQQPLSLLVADLDKFKQANDIDGHDSGNQLLREFAVRLSAVAAGKGTVYRWGGDEFTVLLPNHSLDEGVAVAERIRVAVDGMKLKSVAVSASIGVATAPDHAADADALFEAADAALRTAKLRGRNIVRHYNEEEPADDERQRKPARKQPPPPSGLTPEDAAAMRRLIIRQRPVHCPSDRAPLRVTDITSYGSEGDEFMVTCPDCNWTARLLAPEGR